MSILPAFLILLCALGRGDDRASLLTNGSFERDLAGWDAREAGGMSGAKPEAAHAGELGLRLNDDDAGRRAAVASAAVHSAPGKRYELGFWARIMSGGDASVCIEFFNADDAALSKIEAQVKGSEWKHYVLRGSAPDETETLRVTVHTPGEGKSVADFDEFSLVEPR